jgi:hypothetical protein
MSRQGSAASIGSRKSTGRYKTLGQGGVDDSLFGGKASQQGSKALWRRGWVQEQSC